MRKKFHSLKSSAKSRGLSLSLTYEQFRLLKRSDCHYCGISSLFLQFYCEELNVNTPWMSIDRKINDIGYHFENVVPSCFLCNKIKGSFFNEEEMKQIGKLFVAPKFKAYEDEAMYSFEEWCKHNFDFD